MTECNEILTSFYEKDKICIGTNGSRLIIDSLPDYLLGNELYIKIVDKDEKEVFLQNCSSKLPIIAPVPYLSSGCYKVNVLYHSRKSNSMYGLNHSQGFPLYMDSGVLRFPVPYPFESNKKIFAELVSTVSTKCTLGCEQSNSFIPNEVHKLALQITKNAYSRYDKIRLVHDWVASNIYYDCDSIKDNSYSTTPSDVITVLHKKRTVCVGFARLVMTLLKAAGVPAITMDCFALGQSTHGGWELDINKTSEANHIIVFAFSEDRLIMMDPTWDSDNRFENGKFIQQTGFGVSHQFFDCTLMFFSYTHRFIKSDK